MRKFVLITLSILLTATLQAQNVREELLADFDKAGSNYHVYLGPTEKLTPAPKGKKPFYISHYGRHGSRYLIHHREYDYPYATLMAADQLGKLSEKGKLVLEHVRQLREEAKNRLGELTPLGAEQHQGIARRMYERFPEVFKGEVCIDAKSTVVIRCIISMDNALRQFAALNPKLHITSDASEYDMYYMNHQDRELFGQKWPKQATDIYNAYCKRHARHQEPMGRLFNDKDYAWQSINLSRLNLSMFKLASSVQGTEAGKQFSLFKDLYTPDELYHNWLQVNAYWYIGFGPSPLNGGTQPFTQRNLLWKIIEEADSCLALPRPGATLRFGHETIVLPLACLLGLNGFDQQMTDLEELEGRGWINYKVFPMAANLQFVFYRSNPKDEDVLVKILLNENEATLPIPSDCAPYYHWKDFREFYLKKLASYVSSTMTKQPIEIVVHRGANALAPENTWESAKAALDYGAKWIEVDVRKSKDGVLFNLHDETLDRTTDGKGLLSDMLSEDVRKLDAGSWMGPQFVGLHVPTIAEMLDSLQDKAHVFFDVKRGTPIPDLVSLVREKGFADKSFFWFGDEGMLREFISLAPEMKIKVNAGDIERLKYWQGICTPSYVEIAPEKITDKFCSYCHQHGIKVMAACQEDDTSQFQLVIDKQADLVNLDRPEVFLPLLQQAH